MLMQIGSVAFTIVGFNTHEYQHSAATEFVRKPVLGGRQPLEHVGEGEEKLTFIGRLAPRHLGGLKDLAEMHAVRVAAQPQLVVRGDGVILGWHVIEAIEEQSAHLDRQGVGQQIDFTVTLCRTDKPSGASFAFSLFGAVA